MATQKTADPSARFQAGHNPPAVRLQWPANQADMAYPPTNTSLPSYSSPTGYESYKAAGKLQGKKAVITGGDSGIGRAIAILFAMEGADSLIVYLPQEEEDAQETKRLVNEAGRECFCLGVDLRKKENCRLVVEKAVQCLGGVDCLVNNAAWQNMVGDLGDLEDEQWEKTFDTNIHSIFYLTKYALPHLKPGSTILNCASINAYIGRQDLVDYSATKGALIVFTRALSNQQVRNGIRVNCVCPGPIWTPLIPTTMTTEAIEKLNEVPMGRPGQPSEVATCFVFLASSDSSYMSGQCLHPNGGVVVNG